MDTETVQNGDNLQDSSETFESQNSKSPCNDSGCESLTLTPKLNEKIEENENKRDQDDTDIDDIIILRKDPKTNRSIINRQAYLKLHRATSPTGKSSNILRGKYEANSEINAYLRSRRSTSSFTSPTEESSTSFRYSASNIRNSKIPVPKPRNLVHSDTSAFRTRIPPDRTKSRLTFPFGATFTKKDENSNLLRKNSSSSGEFITVVTRSDSEGSIDKLKSELDLFTMDDRPKEKKRSNSFRRIFSGKIFSKEKKKKDDPDPLRDPKLQGRVPCKENVVYSDNMKNETNAFNRHAPYRHTVDRGHPQQEVKIYRNNSLRSAQKPNYDPKQLEQRYAQMHINEFNKIKRNFENSRPPTEQYVRMDKPFITNNPGPVGYTKMENLSKYIDSSSSVSTLDSERGILYQNEVIANAHRQYVQQQQQQQIENVSNSKSMKFGEYNKEFNRDTPPRAQEVRQNVRLVNPKALIPINSERPLPNPYHHNDNYSNGPSFRSNSHHSLRTIPPQDHTTNNPKSPHLEENYGTVFDSVDHPQKKASDGLQRAASFKTNSNNPTEPIRPSTPSLESTKLKLPANREIVPLSPRMKSPIPQDKISTEKIIATELLKSRTPTPTRKPITKPLSPSHQKLEIAIDYPDNVKDDRSDNNSIISEAVSERPSVTGSAAGSLTGSVAGSSRSLNPENIHRQVLSRVSPASEQHRASPISLRSQSQTSINRTSAASPIPENREKITTNAVVHVNSMNYRSNLNQLRSFSPGTRSITPVDLRTPTSNSSQSPQKDEMRRNVEAYYWKELKRLKDQEDLYYYHMQMMRTPNGYAEDPISTRRARSMSPTSHRNGRRSLSLPRDPKPSSQPNQGIPNQYVKIPQNMIPEDGMMSNNVQLVFDFNTQQFRRNAPERRTIDTPQRGFDNNSLYRPIFKRGSLSTPVRDSSDDGQNKRVSFSSSRVDVHNPQSWPTKNGYTQSPPQRRPTEDDDVFLPPNVKMPTSKLVIDGKEIYGYANKPPTYAEYQQKYNEQYQTRQNALNQLRPPLYDAPPTYVNTNAPRESPYGPLVVANVRQPKPNPPEPPYGPLVMAHNQPPRRLHHQQDESPYGQQIDAIPRHGPVQIREPVYAQKPPLPRKMSYDPSQNSVVMRNENQIGPRREIIMSDDIFGQFGGYLPPNGNVRFTQQNAMSARQNMGEMQHPRAPNISSHGQGQMHESPYGYSRGIPRQVSVRNKVCDIYGQIHDKDSPGLTPSHQRSGVVLGQIQNSNQALRQQQSYGQLPNENFVRNSRLTASANDMYRRYQNVDPRYRNEVYQNQQRHNPEEGPPNRPLPPVPTDKRLQSSDKSKSDNDLNGTQKVKKNKKRSFFESSIDANNNRGTEDVSGNSLSIGDLRRLVLLEELQLIRIQKDVLERNLAKSSSDLPIPTKDERDTGIRNLETDETESMNITELKRLVLTEKLQLVRLQIRAELENAECNISRKFHSLPT